MGTDRTQEAGEFAALATRTAHTDLTCSSQGWEHRDRMRPVLAEQPTPSVTAGVDDLASGLKNAVRETIVSEMEP